MEKARSQKIKDFLLSGFVMICVALILMFGSTHYQTKVLRVPIFIGESLTISGSFYLTRTAIAEDALLGTGTPTPEEKKHKEQTLTPMPTPTLLITAEADK